MHKCYMNDDDEPLIQNIGDVRRTLATPLTTRVCVCVCVGGGGGGVDGNNNAIKQHWAGGGGKSNKTALKQHCAGGGIKGTTML